MQEQPFHFSLTQPESKIKKKQIISCEPETLVFSQFNETELQPVLFSWGGGDTRPPKAGQMARLQSSL